MAILTFSADLDTNQPLVEPSVEDGQLKATAYFEDFLHNLFQDIENINTLSAGPAYGDLTADVGGKSLAPEQVTELLAALREKPIESTTEFESRWQLTDTWIDAWALFIVIVGLLSLEWYLRKSWSMV